jgi:Tfp pilus assembly protein PilF
MFIQQKSDEQYKDNWEELATEKFDQALKLDPHNPESKYYLGLIQYEKGKLKPALDLFRESLKFSVDKPLRYKTLIQVAKIYLKEKSPILAEEYVEKAVNLLPKRGEAYYYQAIVYEQMGKMKKSKSAAQKAVELGIKQGKAILDRF